MSPFRCDEVESTVPEQRSFAADLDLRLLERTVELARKTTEFYWKKLPRSLRVAIDSSPLEGAGRVEDTINLLAHAGRKIVSCAAALLDWTEERVLPPTSHCCASRVPRRRST